MKQMLVAGLAGLAAAQKENCLYCRYTDLEATFLESHSYCDQTKDCLADAWNYIDRPCPSEWKRGKEMTLDDCEAQEANCPSFISSKQYDLNEPDGRPRNITFTLRSGQKCNVKIDATEYVGRVLFANIQGFLGVEYEGYVLGEKITVDSGVEEILIYNANETNNLRF